MSKSVARWWKCGGGHVIRGLGCGAAGWLAAAAEDPVAKEVAGKGLLRIEPLETRVYKDVLERASTGN